MLTKSMAVAKAAAIKASVDAVETALNVGDLDTAKTEFDRLHAKLNGAAIRLAEVYGEADVGVFSGGTGKPATNED